MQQLTLQQTQELIDEGTLLIDTRTPELFADSYPESAINISWGPGFLTVFQTVVEDDQPVIIIADDAIPVIREIAKTGFGGVRGYIDIATSVGLQKDLLVAIDADEFKIDYNFDEFYLVDVRSEEAFAAEHLEDSTNIALDDVEALTQDLSIDMNIYIIADNANNAMTGASIFKRNDFDIIRAVLADFNEFRELKLPIVKAKKGKDSGQFSSN
jgi:hydroxyacylglutathione hydrolase